jgi:probable F420-dependent oxidoreductase
VTTRSDALTCSDVSHPFRFGVHLWRLPTKGWRARAQRYEQAGFSTITLTDHMVVPQWEPFTGLSAIAAVTERIGIGTLVLDAPLRDPVLTAKSAATLELLSGGRLELGVGAGYVSANFAAVGRVFEPAATRLARLDEWVTLVRRLWTEPSTTMHGRFYQVADSPMVAAEPVRPRLLVGGGGKHLLGLAGRMADTASLIPRQTSGAWSVTDSLPDSTLEHMIEKAAWVHQAASAAGRDHQSIELNTMVSQVIVGDDPEGAIASEAAAAGITREQMADSTLYLCGTGSEVRDRLELWRQRTGLSYFSLFDPGDEQIDYLAEHVVGPLAGQ